MKAGHKITLEVPDELFEKSLISRKKRTSLTPKKAVFELLKYALTLPPYFKDFDWKKAEKEADAEIKTGKVKSFSSVDDFLADLKA